MKTLQLKPGITWVGVLDRNLRTFDIMMETEFGSTYNSYVVQGSEKTALIEAAKENFTTEYLDKVRSVVPLESLDYIVVDHTEPDHVGCLAEIVKVNPNVEIYGSILAIRNLQNIMHIPFRSHAVKEGETLSLGDRTLRFYSVPQLHWPDSIYTYLEEDGILFSCDSFGAHYCHDEILLSTVTAKEDYHHALKYYYDMILKPFQPFMRKALAKVQDLPLTMICTGHGPVIDCDIPELLADYQAWSAPAPKRDKKVAVICYVSAYGYTRHMAKLIAKGITEAGAEARVYDMERISIATIAEDLRRADGILLGSPTMLADALPLIYHVTTHMNPIEHGNKQAAAFGSYGWSGEAIPNLTQRLTQLKMYTREGLAIPMRPNTEGEEQCIQFGRDFATSM